MKNNKEKIFKTDNFYLSAYLVAEGFGLSGLEPSSSEGEKFVFCFFNSDELQEKIAEFFSFRALVKPQDYANALKSLRSIIYSKKMSHDS